MIKYEILREDHIEAIKGTTPWTTSNMLDFNDNRTATYLEVIASFESLQEAITFFENEKKRCNSYYSKSSPFSLVLFDLIELRINEYAEAGEFIQTLDVYDFYVSEVKKTEV